MPAASAPKRYNPRHPERTLLYQMVAEHYETWLDLASAGQFEGHSDYRIPKPYVRRAFAKCPQCGIFAHGFARARCGGCGHDFFVAFSCKGRGVCPSRNTRHMAETAAHLTDHVFPRLPVRQWVLSVPKRLRYFMQRDAVVLNVVLRIFLRVIAQRLQAHGPGAANVNKAALHIGAVAFIHRFGSSLNEHVHFHVCAVDGVFEAVAGGAHGAVNFHAAAARAIDEAAVAQVQERLRRRLLRAFVGRGLLDCCEAKEMLGYTHSGFSVDASVCIEANDRAGLERLLRYCARPPFAMERLAKVGSALVYRCAKQPCNNAGELTLSPVALIARIAALVPPPRTHQHRYFGALAPNSPLRAAVVLMAASGDAEQALPVHPAQTAVTAVGEGAAGTATFCAAQSLPAPSILPEPEPPKRSQAHYLWAVLIARIYELFPLLCPICGGQMRILAFVTHRADIRHLLDHIGVASEPPHIAPARGPPLWEAWDAHMGEGSQGEPDWDRVEKPAPDYELDQRVNW